MAAGGGASEPYAPVAVSATAAKISDLFFAISNTRFTFRVQRMIVKFIVLLIIGRKLYSFNFLQYSLKN